ncbi:TniB family NTP-binding protein [Pseudomonas aeruginosa]|uniref:TniB family NTP-binding protein n=1 Tax=Pseudomonas aeruginosa TaxID=287 RepID=UPI0005B4C127|nr:TniB family NTP-binding protein [Pseudomonas aeruginosa]MDA3152025.1 TniB family NTP-binding protein [Pseudomonas aeruginosa]
MSTISSDQLIEHMHFTAALDRAESMIQRALAGESLILPILGPTRVGKTELISAVIKSYPEAVIEGVRRQRVVRVMTPVKPSRRSLPEAVLAALGARRYGRASADELTARVCDLLRIVDTRVLIFEEMQHFVENMSSTATREAADWLKVVAEELRMSVLMIGLPISAQILVRNEQLRDRAEAIHEFRPYSWEKSYERQEFRRTLLGVSEALIEGGWSVPAPHCLEFSRRVYGSCLGRVGMLIKLFNTAEHLARDRVIDYDCLFAAHAQAIGTGFLQFNPFDRSRELVDSLLLEGYVRMLREAHMSVPKAGVEVPV